MGDRVLIFDTTLRDGEQAPGCSMTLREKLRIAKSLAELNVDIIEAGFPAASPGDFAAVKAIADEDFGPVICGLARCNPADIEKVHAAVKGAARHRIHVFVATSAIHREHKLRMAKEEIIKSAVGAIRMAREMCADVEFSPEDASRTELVYLAEVVSAAIEAGATTVNIPDTVGYTVPAEFDELFRYLKAHVTGIDRIALSVHCHDDLGMAVANSLAAVRAGARQIECTINGIGERAGNCSLEEVVMALKTRAEFFNLETGVDSTRLYPASRLVSSITGMQVPRNKAIVGENAFAHEAGIHQHGMLQHRSTYEIMRPEDVGLARSSLVLGKHSGRHAFRDRVTQLGFRLDEFEINRAFLEFKKLADKKKDVYDGDIEAIIMNVDSASAGPWTLQKLDVHTSSETPATASVTLLGAEARTVTASATGDGPVAAAFAALEQATEVHITLKKFELHSTSMGEDAQGEVNITVQHGDDLYRGNGASVDIVEAGARACLEVINRIIRRRERSGEDPRLHGELFAGHDLMPATLFEKVWRDHVVIPETRDTPAVLYVDLHLIHEVTTPQAFALLRQEQLPVRRPDLTLATMDHSTPTLPGTSFKDVKIVGAGAAKQIVQMQHNCADFGIALLDEGSAQRGIVHVIGPELGATQPGMTVVCGDSHTSTHGAFGALAFGIGTTEVGHVLATQCLLQRKAKTLAVEISGQLPDGVCAKDLILGIIGQIGVNGGTGHVIEYRGDAISAMGMEARMTICNMSIEAGARAGMIAPDDTTIDYLAGRPRAPRGTAWDKAVARWRGLISDADAAFDATVSIDASQLEPMVTFGTNPGMVVGVNQPVPDGRADPSFQKALNYMQVTSGKPLTDTEVDVVFIGSCTNSRLSDLQLAAGLLEGRRIAEGVTMLVVPGSQQVKRQAEAIGLHKVFLAAGAEWRESGCSMCLGMNGDTVPAGKLSVSTSNRNFEGRQGAGARTILASPLTAAASAIRGRVSDPRPFMRGQ